MEVSANVFEQFDQPSGALDSLRRRRAAAAFQPVIGHDVNGVRPGPVAENVQEAVLFLHVREGIRGECASGGRSAHVRCEPPAKFSGHSLFWAVQSLRSQRWNPLAAPRSTAAVLALVAAAVRRHQHAALGAGWRAFVQIAQFCRRGRVHGARGLGRLVRHGAEGHRWRRHHFAGRRAVELQVVGGDKLSAEPARDVVEHGAGEADLRIHGDAGRLEARVDELVHQRPERYAVLQADRNRERQAVHHAG